MRYLVVHDVSEIQQYVFRGNRLRMSVGASELVARLTQDVPTLYAQGLSAQRIMQGGGKSVYVVDGQTEAEAFRRNVEKWALEFAPGLKVASVVTPVDGNGSSTGCGSAVIKTAYKQALAELEINKRRYGPPAMPLAIAGTHACGTTGLPASRKLFGSLFSSEIRAKNSVVRGARRRLDALRLNVLTDDRQRSYVFPKELDQLGRSVGESSYIAIVHVDGDGIGQVFQNLVDEPGDDGGFLNRLQDISSKVSDIVSQSFVDLLKNLAAFADGAIAAKPDAESLTPAVQLVRHSGSTGEYYLPIRPLVMAGDDVTFVCDGRLGLSLATRFLDLLYDQDLNGAKFSASAGVAIIGSHAPFAAGYQLAEDLCRSAKRKRRECQSCLPAIDWQIVRGSLLGRLSDMRRRELRLDRRHAGRKLSMRPMLIRSDHEFSWSHVEEGLRVFREKWSQRKSALADLVTALRRGPNAVMALLERLGACLPKLPAPYGHVAKKYGWYLDECPYFDALELLRFHVPLVEKSP